MPHIAQNPARRDCGDVFSLWVWALPVILVVAALAMRQIDLYPPTTDEFYSMFNSGWVVNGPYSLAEVIESLQKHSPNHTPGYFLLLSVWGNLTAFDIAIGRILTILCALLALSITYRLVKDFLAPVAGLFAVVIVASNAFYNFYIPHARMYPLLMFLAGIVFWLYLRILYHVKKGKTLDFIALCLAVFCLMNTHIFSATFLMTIGVYHLIFVPKNKIWWKVSASFIVAIVLFSPYIAVLISSGTERTIIDWIDQSADGWRAVGNWITLLSNNQPLLLLLSIVGLALGARQKKYAIQPYLLLAMIFILVLGMTAQFTPFIAGSGMRHQLPGWFTLVLVIAAGLYALYRNAKYMAILLLLWVAAGLSFQLHAEWEQFIAGRAHAFSDPVWHVISRTLAERSDENPVIAYNVPTYRISHPRHISYSQREYFFDQRGIDLIEINDPIALETFLQGITITVSEFWTIYQSDNTEKNHVPTIRSITNAWQYAACETLNFGIDTVLERYRWRSLGCEPAPESLSKHNELIHYNFYAAQVDSTSSRVFFVDKWEARSEASLDSYSMSFQLISQDRTNEAQLDLPMVHEGMLRHFSIDIAQVPRERYMLMAILYDKLTGERVAWSDSSANPTEYLQLADVVLE